MSDVRRRYNLILKDITTTEEFYIKNYFGDQSEFGRKNYLLSSIDELTIDYDNEEEFLEMIKSYIGFDIEHYKLYIKYREGKEDRYLNLAYNDKSLLKSFAENSKTLIQDGPLYRKFYKHFMTNINKGSFYRYMTENNYINKRLKKLLEEYLYENQIYREKEIIDHLKNYRVIRDYVIGMFEYNKIIKNPNMKINYNDINYQTNLKKEAQQINKTLKLKTDDDFLNGLTSQDEILKYYDLDDLISLEDDVRIIDGMGPKENVKKLILKRE